VRPGEKKAAEDGNRSHAGGERARKPKTGMREHKTEGRKDIWEEVAVQRKNGEFGHRSDPGVRARQDS